MKVQAFNFKDLNRTILCYPRAVPFPPEFEQRDFPLH